MHLKVIQTMTKIPRSVGIPPLSDQSFDRALVDQVTMTNVASSSASTSTTTAAPPQRRHDLVFDMDPIIPPSDGTKTDPRMGIVNLDSNRKAEPHELPKPPQVPSDVPAPDVPGDGSLDPAYPDVYHAPSAAPEAPVTPAPTA